MKIYDCFTFFNELDVLEIRLEELWNTVDYFVLAEATISHSGNTKELLFQKNIDRFKKYMSKIKHIIVDDIPETNDSWVRERFQRKALERGLTDVSPEDIIIVSDVDEVPRAEIVNLIKTDENNYDRYILTIPLLQFRMNYMLHSPISKQPNIMITRGRVFTDPQQERSYTWPWITKPDNIVFVDHAGWHFTYFGDLNHAHTKIKNFAHTESNIPRFTDGSLTIEWMVENRYGIFGIEGEERFEIIQVDSYFPEFVTSNLDRWKHMIEPGAVFKATDLYRENKESYIN